MKVEQYTYWSVTINNPDENDYVLIRNPNDKYIRSLVWTPEEGGEEHTPHIQAWVRMQRNVTQAFMKKIYPRAHFRYITKDEYNENCHAYAQKNDETTKGMHHISLNDPLPANDTLLYQVLERSFEKMLLWDKKLQDFYSHEPIYAFLERITLKQLNTMFIERLMVTERAGLEKIFVSPAYDRMKSTFWREILIRLYTKRDGSESDNKSQGQEDDAYESGPHSHRDEESTACETEGRDESSCSASSAGSDF